MADTYSYGLLVEFEENKVPRLKNKLVKYFQSKKSNGGDCEVDYENGSGTAVLRFCKEEDQQNVLRKEDHQISLDKGPLKMTVRRLPDEITKQEAPPEEVTQKYVAEPTADVAAPTTVVAAPTADVSASDIHPKSTGEPKPAAKVQTEVKGGNDEAEDEELCSTLAVLENIPENVNQEYLEMLVENVLKDPDNPSVIEIFTLEVLPGTSSAVVTFKTPKENSDFVSRCPKNRNFIKKKITGRQLEVTKQALIDDVQDISDDFLRLYFENAGGDLEDFELNKVEQSAIITFKDHKAVQKILKKKHDIKRKEIRVYPFYKSLGIALYGKDTPSLKLPAAISEPIDEAVWRYLNDKQSAAETIHAQLNQHFCKVNLDQPTVCLSPVSSLLQEKDAKATIKEWKDTVKAAFAHALSKFQSLKLQPEPTEWEESESKIRETLQNEDVVVVPDKASGVFTVVGPVGDVNRLQETLYEIINKIVKRVHRQKLSVTQDIKVSKSIFHILCQDGIQDKLLRVYPELKMSYTKESPNLVVTGLMDEILAASKVIYDAKGALKRQNLEIDTFVLDLLKDEHPEQLTNALLTSSGIDAAFEIHANKVQLLAVSDRGLMDAENHLGRLLVSRYIGVEDSNVLKKPEWTDLVSQSEKTNNKSMRRIRIDTTGKQVVVSGYTDSVEKVSNELEDFLRQNAQVEETVKVKPEVVVEYIKKLGTSSLKHVEHKVKVHFKKEAISLSGCRVHVTECKTLIDNLVSSLCFEQFKVSKPGVKTFFQDKEAMYTSSIFHETHSLVQLVDGTNGEQDDHRQFPKPVYQLQTPDGAEIAVCKADMCSYPVDAVVNAANEKLNLSGGLAGAILSAAGPQLQDECDKLIRSHGQLKPGDSVITGAGGQLPCKKVIHAVGPVYNSANPMKAKAQLKKAVKGSLGLAEKHGCVSVALPAISKNQGFPLDLCAVTIVIAVKEHFEEIYDDNSLKRIHLVNNDDSAVRAMELAVRQEFGSHGVTPSQQTLPKKPPVPLKPSGSDPNCLGQVQTKEGVAITVMKGCIEAATTEVTVNTLSKDLDLTRGAVSNAIFRIAGSKLQTLVKANNANVKEGDIIVTEGCNLKSKQVFHAVAPHWDKGQGTAEKTLTAIFSDCFDKAEASSYTSISLPAIGTGNLGFNKDLVASLLLKKILEFSSKKQPKHLKKVVIILYPGDAKTIQAFSDEFQKNFPNASSGPVPSSSTQSSGPFSKVVSGSGIHETKMGGVVVQVVTGDITKENSDVIVNSSNEDFSLKTGVSKAILEAAGQAVEADCQVVGAQPHTGMIMTQPGNLKCKKIIHVVGRTDPAKINVAVKNALLMCLKNSFTSVSFPAIGTGQGNVQAKQVADAMLDAVIEVLSQNTSSALKTIRLVIFQPPMLQEFYNSMQQREAKKDTIEPPKEKAGLWDKFKSLFVTAEKPQKEGDFVIDPLTVDPACFHICGDSQARVDSAKKWINDLISKEHNNISISDNVILSFSDADHQKIVDMQKTMNISIRIESKNGQASVTIEGLSKEVLKASNVIHTMLKKARDDDELKKKVALAGTLADWQYLQPGLQFRSFDSMNNYKLENALERKLPDVKVTVQGKDYTVTMPGGPATDGKGGTLEIKRIDKLKDENIPDFWEAMPANVTSKAITIQPGTAEHTEILNLFQASCKLNVIKIERIQNISLWQSLQIKKRDMEQRNGHQNNEKRLFHGTSEDTVAYINEHGFNRSYAGKNAACYGNGTYFAVNASYSASDTYSKPNQNMEKSMYLCRVLTGDFTVGKQNMITPPTKGPVSVQKYDSVVDNIARPSMFVVFHDSQACPEYLITFK
uniref:poly(ADP-ribose) polymerase family member 14-related sequence 1 isoform X1 n=1 Tax=Semicossyphus pulcher TaxID=241346 RepID=UPI0037E7907B